MRPWCPASSAEVDQALIDDFGPRLRGDVAAQVDVEFAGDFQVVGGPGVAHGIEQIDAAAARDRDQRIGFRLLAHRLHWLEVHACQRADDFQMAQFLGADIHQKIFALRIIAIEALDGILHGGGELAIGAAELFKQHVAETGIRLVYADGVHKLFDVMVHEHLRGCTGQSLCDRLCSKS